MVARGCYRTVDRYSRGLVKLCLWMGKREGFESGVKTTLEDIKEDIRMIRIAIADLVTYNDSKNRQ